MPLVIMTGFPASGKTRRAEALAALLRARIATSDSMQAVHVINDESLHVAKRDYGDSSRERTARTSLLSAVEKRLSGRDIVVCDGLNYIKGFRYQLFCLAKNNATAHCVVHTLVPVELCRRWNAARDGPGYPAQLFDDLVARYEEPSSTNRWDAPLHGLVYDDETLPLDAIWGHFEQQRVTPNFAALAHQPTEHDSLHELERTTQEVILHVADAHRSGFRGPVAVPGTRKTVDATAEAVTMPRLQRIKRQFVVMNRLHVLERARIRDEFVDFLNSQLD